MTRADAPVLIAAGGTGGHVVPALAVADVLRERNVPVVWAGTRNGIEARLIPQEGIELRWIDIAGLRGKGIFGVLLTPGRLIRACLQSLRLLSSLKPRAVLGMGGFVSGPVGLAAVFARRPLILHEQNAIAGMTNRHLARWATQVFCAWPEVFPTSVGAITTGNPVRRDMLMSAETSSDARHNDRDSSGTDVSGMSAADSVAFADSSEQPMRLLVVGGSRGARVLNQVVPEALSRLCFPVEVLHQSGQDDEAMVRAAYATVAGPSLTAQVQPFIREMGHAYASADLVICRAGAMTVTELAARGVASILVPFPYAVDDHQTQNARRLSEAGAAVLMPQPQFNADSLAQQLEQFHADPSQLTSMAHAARAGFQANAAEAVADALLEVSR